eukprot:jgi/Chrzof1/8645/Cz03g18220.t1
MQPGICWAEFKKQDPLCQRPAREQQRGRPVEWFNNETSRLEVVNRELVKAEERYKQCLLDLYGAEYIREVYGEEHGDTARPPPESPLPPAAPTPHEALRGSSCHVHHVNLVIQVMIPVTCLKQHTFSCFSRRKRNITYIFDIHGNRVARKEEPVVIAPLTPPVAPSQDKAEVSMVEAVLVQPEPAHQEEVVVVVAPVTPPVAYSQNGAEVAGTEAVLVQPEPVQQDDTGAEHHATLAPETDEAVQQQPEQQVEEEVDQVAAVAPEVIYQEVVESPEQQVEEEVDQVAAVAPEVVYQEVVGSPEQQVDEEVGQATAVAPEVSYQEVVGSAPAAPGEELQAAVDVTCQVTLQEGAVHAKPAKGGSSKLKALKKAIGAAWRSTQDKSWQLMKKISFVSRGAPASKAPTARVSCGCFGF